MSRMQHRRSGERGAAAVELALVLPILVMIFFGITEFGRGYAAKTAVTSAAREGARAMALNSDHVKAARDATGWSDPTALAVTAVSSCPAQPVASPTPPTATVRTSYAFTYRIPFVKTATITLTSQGSMRCGG